MEVVREARRALSSLVRSKPAAWAPVVASWAVELLGQLSSRYAGRHGARGLNELLQLWTGCEATRTLLELYGQCFGALLGSCPDACVAALLDTSLQHSPHFDWVVAHVGGAFPGTIISRVLACGLKDYCAHLEALGGGSGVSAPPLGPGGAPKLASVVGILGHLASRHGASIRQELLRLFHASLAPGGGARGGVGFLLQLALLSPPLLGAVWGELVAALTPPVLAQLHQRFAPLPREELEGLGGVLVRLLGQTSAGAPRTLRFLLDTAAPPGARDPPPDGPEAENPFCNPNNPENPFENPENPFENPKNPFSDPKNPFSDPNNPDRKSVV